MSQNEFDYFFKLQDKILNIYNLYKMAYYLT